MLHELRPAKGAVRPSKRVGRGPGSGHGKTSCRGQNGQGQRSGSGKGPGFEGGQMPLQRRLPKRGFTHLREIEYVIINLERLSGFAGGAVVSPDTLFEQGMIRRKSDRVKILGDGGVAVPLTVRVHKISKSARQKIEAAGGTVEVLA